MRVTARGVVAGLAVLAALSAFPREVSARSITVKAHVGGIHEPVVAGEGLYYRSLTRRAESIRRVDLETGTVRTVYSHDVEPFSIDTLRSGGGQALIGISAPGKRYYVSRVLRLSASGDEPTRVASGKYRMIDNLDENCGTVVALKDVSRDGEILIDEGRTECDPDRPDSAVLRAHRGSSSRELLRREAEDPFDLADLPEMQLAGNRLLTGGETRLVLTDIRTGAIRTVARTGRGWFIERNGLDAAGNVLLTEIQLSGLKFRGAQVRLVGPSDDARAGAVLFRARHSFEDARFCGDRVTEYWISAKGRERLTVRQGAERRVLLDRRRKRFRPIDFDITCDDRTIVIGSKKGRKRARLTIFELD